MKRIILILSVIIIITSLNACFLASTVEEFRTAGLTESGRQTALNREMKSFHHALFWTSINEALGFAKQENFDELKERLQDMKDQGRVVETKIEYVDFQENAYQAEAEVQVNFLDKSTNIVEPYNALEKWTFSLSDGWKLESISKLEENA